MTGTENFKERSLQNTGSARCVIPLSHGCYVNVSCLGKMYNLWLCNWEGT